MIKSRYTSKSQLSYSFAALAIASLVFLSSCATRSSTEPAPTTTTQNAVTLDEFYTPAPNGDADDYYVLQPGEDDIEYSYFIDEQDYNDALDHHSDPFVQKLLKGGHGYGDANHIHEFIKGPHHYHGVYIGIRRKDWTDSLALTDTEKIQIQQAMTAFLQCADTALIEYRTELAPARTKFRTTRLAIIAGLDSGIYTRDSARTLLDSAIVTYETATSTARAGFKISIKDCLDELNMSIETILTPAQYQIWVRHRGW
jgi:hypothetical protein